MELHEALPKIPAAIKTFIKDPENKGTKKGLALAKTLGINLKEQPFVWIQKVLNTPSDVAIVVYDSRWPKRYLSIKKVRGLKCFKLWRLKIKQSVADSKKKFVTTIPVLLQNFQGRLSSGALIICVDISGETWLNPKLYKESIINSWRIIK